jgi:SAM-dependent methyltransferase
MSKIKLDIGCGRFKKTGYYGVDMLDLPGVDYVVDLRKEKLPFGDNSVDVVYSSHFLEHLEIENIAKVLEEIFRVCKNGALVQIRVPHFSGFSNFYEYHKTSFRYNSFREFIVGEEGMFKSKARFRLISRWIVLPKRKGLFWNFLFEPIANRHPNFYEVSFLRCLFPAYELIFVLRVVKDEHK